MSAVSEQQILAALDGVVDPATGRGLAAAGRIVGLVVRDGNVGFAVDLDGAAPDAPEALRQAAGAAVRELPGVLSVTVALTAHKGAPPGDAPPVSAPPASAPPASAPGPAGKSAADPRRPGIPGVRSIIAVASGKGGVGKSTCAANLALALAADGLAVGVLDADIYGPSMPRMFGITDKPTTTGEGDNRKLVPLEAWGVRVMSIGFLVDEETPTIWRGPMVMGALEQLLRDVEWGALDVLVVDMPPGTGDTQLTLSQRVPLAGAVIVSTPQDIALIDARKGLNMFRRVEVPVLGIVENMSSFHCPHCGERSDIFGHGGARTEADRLGVDFLGEVPLDMAIRETSDSGRPVVVSRPDGPQAKAFFDIARKVAALLATDSGVAAPRIVIT